MAIFSRCAISFKRHPALWGAGLLLAWTCLMAPAQASSMPGADRPRTRLNLGSAPSLGLDWRLDERMALGLNVAAPFYFFSNFGTTRYSLHGVYQLMNNNGAYMALVMGFYGDLYFPELSRYPQIAVQGGAAFAYDLNRDWTLRLNIVPGIALQLPPEGWLFFPPAGGVELAWHPGSHFEMSLGYNGNGDILALSWIL